MAEIYVGDTIKITGPELTIHRLATEARATVGSALAMGISAPIDEAMYRVMERGAYGGWMSEQGDRQRRGELAEVTFEFISQSCAAE